MAFCTQQHMCSLCQYLCQTYRTNGQQPRIGCSKFTPNLKTHGPYSANSTAFWRLLFFCLAGTLTVSLKQFCWFRTKLTSMRGGFFDWQLIPSCKKSLKALKWFATPASMRWVKSFWQFHMWTPPLLLTGLLFGRSALVSMNTCGLPMGDVCNSSLYSEVEASFTGNTYLQSVYGWHKIQELTRKRTR